MRLFLAFSLLLFATDLRAETKLTPKEVADGTILLFDGETTFGWKPADNWKIQDGVLISSNVTQLFTTSLFPESQLEFAYRAPTPGHATLGKVQLVLDPTQEWKEVKLPKGQGQVRFAGAGLQLKNIKLTPVGATPLFNGKDLTGWKIFPDKKSKFTIKDGAINIQDGPGDLQTEAKFDDFLLQLECISHGEHLNSGVFFRCLPNEYQKGYEAQIRNQFTPDKLQDYVVEVYDPKTHQLVEKKKVQSPAVDFGTGAIYRRMPSRKGVAKDGEWFTLTLLAHGNHLTTWVNGIQVVDWFDNRPESINAREGQKLDAGHISFQGHDPTTNLSFRNIRIKEWK